MSEEYAPIPLQPPGLLGALQLKNYGKNPPALVGSYQPMLDMREWLLMADVRTAGQTAVGAVTAGLADFASAGLQIPEREWWYIHDFSAHVGASNLATGDIVTISPAYQVDLQTGGDTIVVGPPFTLEVAATAGDLRVRADRVPFLAPPTALFGAWIHQALVAANRNLAVRLRYTRLPV